MLAGSLWDVEDTESSVPEPAAGLDDDVRRPYPGAGTSGGVSWGRVHREGSGDRRSRAWGAASSRRRRRRLRSAVAGYGHRYAGGNATASRYHRRATGPDPAA